MKKLLLTLLITTPSFVLADTNHEKACDFITSKFEEYSTIYWASEEIEKDRPRLGRIFKVMREVVEDARLANLSTNFGSTFRKHLKNQQEGAQAFKEECLSDYVLNKKGA